MSNRWREASGAWGTISKCGLPFLEFIDQYRTATDSGGAVIPGWWQWRGVPVPRHGLHAALDGGLAPDVASLKLKRGIRRLLLLLAVGVIAYWAWDYWRERRFDSLILAAAGRYQIDPGLVKAVVWRESRFDPDARGRAGELGLMQIRSEAAQEWAAAERISSFEHRACLDPATNTLAGAWYLKKLLLRYQNTDNPAAYALADYNAGRSNVLKWLNGPAATQSGVFIGQIGFPATRDYVRAVLRRAADYRPM
jgi:soluble lytic murein transglycosylase